MTKEEQAVITDRINKATEIRNKVIQYEKWLKEVEQVTRITMARPQEGTIIGRDVDLHPWGLSDDFNGKVTIITALQAAAAERMAALEKEYESL